MSTQVHIDHLAIAAPGQVLDEVVEFYQNILGLSLGPTADVEGLVSRWLYSGDKDLIHLIEDNNRVEKGRNSFDHIALRCTGLNQVIQKLEKHEVNFARFDAEEEKQVLIFVEDPAGTSVELNFYNES